MRRERKEKKGELFGGALLLKPHEAVAEGDGNSGRHGGGNGG
jgi:hypothetical protein